MKISFRSSGDLIADRRYAYGCNLAREGDFAAAIDLFEQSLECAPLYAPAWFALGRARCERHDMSGAIAAFRECLKIDPADALGASLELTRLDAAVNVDAAPEAYVRALFDAYAPDFDKALVERLHYSTPQAMAELVRTHLKEGERFARALDLGCGTGLAGEAIVADVGWLEGVDISNGMISAAKSKGVYDALSTADIMTRLMQGEEKFDLILAADVFNYVGDLARLISLIGRRLAPGGLAAFSIERGEGPQWTVEASLRFSHSPDYVAGLIRNAGLSLRSAERSILRCDRGAEVEGVIFVAEKARENVITTAFPEFSEPDGASEEIIH